jgi:hypothetical protein
VLFKFNVELFFGRILSTSDCVTFVVFSQTKKTVRFIAVFCFLRLKDLGVAFKNESFFSVNLSIFNTINFT